MGRVKMGESSNRPKENKELAPNIVEKEVIIEKIVEVPVEIPVEKEVIVEVEKVVEKTVPRNSNPPDRIPDLDAFKTHFEKFKKNITEKTEGLKGDMQKLKAKDSPSKDDLMALEVKLQELTSMQQAAGQKADDTFKDIDSLYNINNAIKKELKYLEKQSQMLEFKLLLGVGASAVLAGILAYIL